MAQDEKFELDEEELAKDFDDEFDEDFEDKADEDLVEFERQLEVDAGVDPTKEAAEVDEDFEPEEDF